MQAKKDVPGIRELGSKLAIFRKKLALALEQKKITQAEFGEMYGGYSGRAIASYELGDVDPPGSLFYQLWKEGNSIDAIFDEGSVTGTGRENARKLLADCVTANLRELTAEEREKILREIKNAESVPPENEIIKITTKRKTGDTAPSENKKR